MFQALHTYLFMCLLILRKGIIYSISCLQPPKVLDYRWCQHTLLEFSIFLVDFLKIKLSSHQHRIFHLNWPVTQLAVRLGAGSITSVTQLESQKDTNLSVSYCGFLGAFITRKISVEKIFIWLFNPKIWKQPQWCITKLKIAAQFSSQIYVRKETDG